MWKLKHDCKKYPNKNIIIGFNIKDLKNKEDLCCIFCGEIIFKYEVEDDNKLKM